MILDDILQRRREQLAREKATLPMSHAQQLAGAMPAAKDFAQALSAPGVSVIAEVKKASPSKGIIAEDFQPVKAALSYESAGAQAISVLTEEHYFLGGNEVLQAIRAAVSLPILRKDFIFDPYQIVYARALGADAVLLIAAMLDKTQLTELLYATGEAGLQALVEVHNEAELATAIESGAQIIGINNRNLHTFEVSFEISRRLIQDIPKDRIRVIESGVTSAQHMRQAAQWGANAVLVGETLMRSTDIAATLHALEERCHE